MKKSKIKRVDQPVFTYFEALYMSFFSARLYVDVGKRWRGLCARYLMILMALASLPLGLSATFSFRHFLDTQVIQPLMQVPPLQVTDGEIAIDQPVPYEIKNPEGKVVIVIDTREKTNVLDRKQYPAVTLAITKNTFFFRLPVVFGLTDSETISNQEMNPQWGTVPQRIPPHLTQILDLKDWLKDPQMRTLQTVLLLLIYPCFFALLLSLNFFLLLIFGFMAQLVSRLFFKFKIGYPQAVRLLTMSFTPYAILGSLISSTQLKIPALSLVLFLIWGGYFIFAIISLRRESNKLVFFS